MADDCEQPQLLAHDGKQPSHAAGVRSPDAASMNYVYIKTCASFQRFSFLLKIYAQITLRSIHF